MMKREFMKTIEEQGKYMDEERFYNLLDRISFYVADYENIFEEINKYINPNAITFKTLAKLIVLISDYSCIESYLLSPAIKYIHKTFKGKFTEFKLLESIIIELYTNPDINKYTRKNIINNLYTNEIWTTVLLDKFSRLNNLAEQYPEAIIDFIARIPLTESLKILEFELNDMNNELLKLVLHDIIKTLNIYNEIFRDCILEKDIFKDQRIVKMMKIINMERKLSKKA